jgi:hypothetical protein
MPTDLSPNRNPSFIFQLLQNLGKADRTTDDIFEEHMGNFNQQQMNANRIHKDISSYVRCIKGKEVSRLDTRSDI